MAARRGSARHGTAQCRLQMGARGTRGESRRFELSAWRRGGGEARRVEGSPRLSSARVMKWSSRSLLRVPLAGSRRALETGGERESPATGTRVRKRTARFLTSASALSRSPALHICSALLRSAPLPVVFHSREPPPLQSSSFCSCCRCCNLSNTSRPSQKPLLSSSPVSSAFLIRRCRVSVSIL